MIRLILSIFAAIFLSPSAVDLKSGSSSRILHSWKIWSKCPFSLSRSRFTSSMGISFMSSIILISPRLATAICSCESTYPWRRFPSRSNASFKSFIWTSTCFLSSLLASSSLRSSFTSRVSSATRFCSSVFSPKIMSVFSSSTTYEHSYSLLSIIQDSKTGNCGFPQLPVCLL